MKRRPVLRQRSEDPHVGNRRLFLSSPSSGSPWSRATKLPTDGGLGVFVLKVLESGMVEEAQPDGDRGRVWGNANNSDRKTMKILQISVKFS